jgi:uncharacterized repeat protein (TIGR03803 family)
MKLRKIKVKMAPTNAVPSFQTNLIETLIKTTNTLDFIKVLKTMRTNNNKTHKSHDLNVPAAGTGEKTPHYLTRLMLRAVMLLGLGLLPMQLPAQTFTVLHRFLPDGVDGATASATLTLNSGIIYGITAKGGTNNGGTLFRIETKGTNYQVLHHFAAPDFYPTNLDWTADGAGPIGGVSVDSNAIYGATQMGGIAGRGMLYKLATNGGDYQALHQFLDFHDGSYPSSGLFLSNDWLYGTCLTDGGDDRPNQQYVAAGGTRFAINTSGSSYRVEGTFQKYFLNPVLLPAYDLVLVPTNAMDTYGFVGISLDKGGFGPEMQSILAMDGHGAGGSPFGAIYGMSEGATFFHYHAFTGGRMAPTLQAVPSWMPIWAATSCTGSRLEMARTRRVPFIAMTCKITFSKFCIRSPTISSREANTLMGWCQ